MTTTTRLSCLDAALDLLSRGLPITLCGDGQKTPPVKAWQHATYSHDEVVQAFQHDPGLNVGVIWGPRNNLIDLEADSPQAEQDFAQLFDGDVPIAPTFSSRRGKHRLFQYDDRLAPLGANKKYGELELRVGGAGKASHSLVPPSSTGGVAREWLLSLDDANAPQLSDAVIQRMLQGPQKSNGKLVVVGTNWTNTLQGVAQGNRNHSAAAYTGKLLKNARQLNEENTGILWDSVQAWNERNQPPLSEAELKGVFNSILSRELNRRGDNTAVEKAVEFNRISSAELATSNYQLEYLVERTLVAGQPAIIAGGKKTLKTSLIVAMGVSLATRQKLFGELNVYRACRTLIMSGESGLATLQETGHRIAQSMGLKLANLSGLIWSDQLPRFNKLEHLEAFERFVTDDEIEVAFIDPTYMAMPGADAGNLFIQGDMLHGITDICQRCGVTLILAHHTRKRQAQDPYQPPELDDIAWAGFPEWARQWILLGRREPYEPGSGEHRLWLSTGGSAGHSALWGLDVAEGVFDGTNQRYWEPALMRAADVRADTENRKIEGAQKRKEEQLEADRTRVADALVKLPLGGTKTDIRDHAGISMPRVNAALASMLQDGHASQTDILKGTRKKPYPGFKLAETDADDAD